MKIAVLHRYPVSQVTGTNASFVAFLEALHERGHQVHLMSFRESRPPGFLDFVRFAELPWGFERGNPRDKLVKTALWIVLAPFLAWRLRRRADLDVIYCDDSVPYYGFLTKLLVGSRARVIIRMGDLQSGYNFAGQGPLKGLLFRAALALERLMWRVVNGTVAISVAFRDFIQAQGIPAEKIAVVRESINLETFRSEPHGSLRDDLGLSREAVVIMFHGALVRCKGAETLIAAIPGVLERCPEAVFVIAGGGSEEARLRELGRPWMDAGRLHFTGWYDHRTLPRLMADVDVGVVMRSGNMANNFVVTTCLLEYWASRKPVLVPDLAAFREVVVAGENGLFYRPDDPDSLTAALLELVRDREHWRSLGDGGYRQAEQLFEHRHIASTMVDALEGYVTRKAG